MHESALHPFFLLQLNIIKLFESISYIDFIHPYYARRYDNNRGNMDKEVVVNVINTVVIEDYYNIGIETNAVNGHHLIPLKL